MAHIFGRVTEEFALSCGAAIGYWQVGALPLSLSSRWVACCAPHGQIIQPRSSLDLQLRTMTAQDYDTMACLHHDVIPRAKQQLSVVTCV